MREKLTASSLKKVAPKPTPYEIVDTEIKGFLLRVQPSGRMTYYFSYRNSEGLKKRIKIGVAGTVSARQARDSALTYAGQVSSGVDIQEEKKTRRQEAEANRKKTLGQFIDNHYRPWVLANRKSGQASLDTLKRNFEPWYDRILTNISVLDVEQWRTKRLDDGKRPTTINRSTATLRALMSKAEAWGIIDHHPLPKLKPLKTDTSPKIRYLSNEEESSLKLALKKRDSEIRQARERHNEFRVKRGREPLPSLDELTFADYLEPMVILSLKTGMRRGEIYDLVWGDIDFATLTITIRPEISKSGKTRHIPLGPSAADTLQKWRAQNVEKSTRERVFPNANGERFDNNNKAWRNVLKQAGITNFRWHDMRHDFASKMVMKGVPLNTVRELCGHTDMNTTLRYAHLAPEHKADAVALLG